MPNSSSATANGLQMAAVLSLLLGIWLFVSPWMYGSASHMNAWNSWIVGFIVFLFALIQTSDPIGTRGFAWANLILGIWVFASPWIYSYTGHNDRFVNSLCVGVVLFVLNAYSASAHVTRTTNLNNTPPLTR